MYTSSVRGGSESCLQRVCSYHLCVTLVSTIIVIMVICPGPSDPN